MNIDGIPTRTLRAHPAQNCIDIIDQTRLPHVLHWVRVATLEGQLAQQQFVHQPGGHRRLRGRRWRAGRRRQSRRLRQGDTTHADQGQRGQNTRQMLHRPIIIHAFELDGCVCPNYPRLK